MGEEHDVNGIVRKIKREFFRKKIAEFKDGATYWEKRYALGGNSGRGSYGAEARFKADFVNAFLRYHDIRGVIDFGCGDGNNLSLIDVDHYIGIDISRTAVSVCEQRFKDRGRYRFFWNDPTEAESILERLDTNGAYRPGECDLSLSMDVIYHLVEDGTYQSYLRDLIRAPRRFVIIYSMDVEGEQTLHVRPRKVSADIAAHFEDLRLVRRTLNPVRGGAIENPHFMVFEKKSDPVTDGMLRL